MFSSYIRAVNILTDSGCGRMHKIKTDKNHSMEGGGGQEVSAIVEKHLTTGGSKKESDFLQGCDP